MSEEMTTAPSTPPAPVIERVDLDALAHHSGGGEQVVAALAEQIRIRSTRPNTRAAYAQDRAHWERYCTIAGLDPDQPSADALTVFATWLIANPGAGVKHAAPATLRRRVSGVVSSWRRRGATVPYRVAEDAMQTIGAHEQWLAEEHIDTGRGQAPLLSVDGLRRIVAACPESPAGLRDRALLLLGFGFAARRSELASLAAADVSVDYDGGALRGVVVQVRTSKTGAGRRVAIVRGADPATCPAMAWMRWSQSAQVGSGPALQRVDRHGHVRPEGLSAEAVGDIIRRAGLRTGDPALARLTGHSLRAGYATTARLAGHDLVSIARVGGWKANSPELAKYLRVADEWNPQDNATSGLGL